LIGAGGVALDDVGAALGDGIEGGAAEAVSTLAVALDGPAAPAQGSLAGLVRA
jgi:hypothetical protein